jgi:catechol 2,3-dioxygenase-like lactoylglutathione lyase family enzyme
MKPVLRDVQHIALNVTDLAAARTFYLEHLGLDEIDRPDFGVPGIWMACGATQIHLVEVDENMPADGQHFAFEVDDMDAIVGDLRAKDVEVSDPFEFAAGAGRQAFLKDPSGNLIELNQPTT